jgi:hypothetical protein
VNAVKKAVATGVPSLAESHRAWWHRFWPEGFVSVPDTRIESFYYIQMYKMASATRPGRPALDLMGPWFRSTPWAKIWWNLNIQLAYWPQLSGNRLELGTSLCELIDHGADALAKNAGQFQAHSAGVGRTSGYNCSGAVGDELCNLPWTMHNYWLQYRYSMDESMLRRLFPMLKRTTNYYLHLLKEGPDGKLHITRGLSPEYENQPKPNPDCNIDLSLLRWGCETLLLSCQLLKLEDPLIPKWKDTLARLTPYPQDPNGLMISASVPFASSHRHYSHLLMIYPLYTMTPEQPENRALVVKSLKHWMGMPQKLAGYSYTGAASISALLGEAMKPRAISTSCSTRRFHPTPSMSKPVRASKRRCQRPPRSMTCCSAVGATASASFPVFPPPGRTSRSTTSAPRERSSSAPCERMAQPNG